ncbi:hypothetical protein CYMTET_40453 [Cymbomonas tetramitiformis]|uniref:Uncharacterized protein n=1 Tax=Cymbomonas tetramitiformis TaxID=36881 RepID=A0AAE0C837_9CHLO|nr:hypothetical protein CYMTET_40453 [Cymbomonas tetramitiformis]
MVVEVKGNGLGEEAGEGLGEEAGKEVGANDASVNTLPGEDCSVEVKEAAAPDAAVSGKVTVLSTAVLPAAMLVMATSEVDTLAEAAICEMKLASNDALKLASSKLEMLREEKLTEEVTISSRMVPGKEGVDVVGLAVTGPVVVGWMVVGLAELGGAVGNDEGGVRRRGRDGRAEAKEGMEEEEVGEGGGSVEVKEAAAPDAAVSGKVTVLSTAVLPAAMLVMATSEVDTLAEVAICEMKLASNDALKLASSKLEMLREEKLTEEVTIWSTTDPGRVGLAVVGEIVGMAEVGPTVKGDRVVGEVEGETVGEAVGRAVGKEEGEIVGDAEGARVGDAVRAYEGGAEGEEVGDAEGWVVGGVVGNAVGLNVGDVDGEGVGDTEGNEVGDADGVIVGGADGAAVGEAEGAAVGEEVGTVVGEAEGPAVGEMVGAAVGVKWRGCRGGDEVGEVEGR